MEGALFALEIGTIEDSGRLYQIHTSAIKELCSSHYAEKEIALWAGKQKQETYVPFLQNGDIIVAKKDGMVVGFIHHIKNSQEVHTNELSTKECSNDEVTVKGLFIDPNFVRKGVGKLLLKQVEAIALENGVAIMKVSASLNSLPFYSKMGFQEVERNMHQIMCACSVECVGMVKHLKRQNNDI